MIQTTVILIIWTPSPGNHSRRDYWQKSRRECLASDSPPYGKAYSDQLKPFIVSFDCKTTVVLFRSLGEHWCCVGCLCATPLHYVVNPVCETTVVHFTSRFDSWYSCGCAGATSLHYVVNLDCGKTVLPFTTCLENWLSRGCLFETALHYFVNHCKHSHMKLYLRQSNRADAFGSDPLPYSKCHSENV